MVLTDEQQAFLLYHNLLHATLGVSIHNDTVFDLLVKLIGDDLRHEPEIRDAMLVLVNRSREN
jgi:hypothetical protein